MTRDSVIFLHCHLFKKVYQEKSAKHLWIMLQVRLQHLRKTIIIFKGLKPASRIEICEIVVCLTVRNKTTSRIFSSFQLQLFLYLQDSEDQKISQLNQPGQ